MVWDMASVYETMRLNLSIILRADGKEIRTLNLIVR